MSAKEMMLEKIQQIETQLQEMREHLEFDNANAMADTMAQINFSTGMLHDYSISQYNYLRHRQL